jgi:hypothetical protein
MARRRHQQSCRRLNRRHTKCGRNNTRKRRGSGFFKSMTVKLTEKLGSAKKKISDKSHAMVKSKFDAKLTEFLTDIEHQAAKSSVRVTTTTLKDGIESLMKYSEINLPLHLNPNHPNAKTYISDPEQSKYKIAHMLKPCHCHLKHFVHQLQNALELQSHATFTNTVIDIFSKTDTLQPTLWWFASLMEYLNIDFQKQAANTESVKKALLKSNILKDVVVHNDRIAKLTISDEMIQAAANVAATASDATASDATDATASDATASDATDATASDATASDATASVTTVAATSMSSFFQKRHELLRDLLTQTKKREGGLHDIVSIELQPAEVKTLLQHFIAKKDDNRLLKLLPHMSLKHQISLLWDIKKIHTLLTKNKGGTGGEHMETDVKFILFKSALKSLSCAIACFVVAGGGFIGMVVFGFIFLVEFAWYCHRIQLYSS